MILLFNLDLITYVQDRLEHDMRYVIDLSKIAKDLGWYPETDFETGINSEIKRIFFERNLKKILFFVKKHFIYFVKKYDKLKK